MRNGEIWIRLFQLLNSIFQELADDIFSLITLVAWGKGYTLTLGNGKIFAKLGFLTLCCIFVVFSPRLLRCNKVLYLIIDKEAYLSIDNLSGVKISVNYLTTSKLLGCFTMQINAKSFSQ